MSCRNGGKNSILHDHHLRLANLWNSTVITFTVRERAGAPYLTKKNEKCSWRRYFLNKEGEGNTKYLLLCDCTTTDHMFDLALTLHAHEPAIVHSSNMIFSNQGLSSIKSLVTNSPLLGSKIRI